MKISLVNFATSNFYYAQSLLVRSAKNQNFDNIYSYRSNDFRKTAFYKEFYSITSQQRGYGYWLWKPYYIKKILDSLNEGDILVYSDAGLEITDSLIPVIKIAQQSSHDVVLFKNYQGSGYFPKMYNFSISEYNIYTEMNKCKYWCKRDAFVQLDADTPEFWESPLVDANFHMYKKSVKSIDFVEQWLQSCCNINLLTDAENVCNLPNFANFQGHLHDQSLLSLHAAKAKIELFRVPSQYGNHYKRNEYRIDGEYLLLPYSSTPDLKSNYGTLLNHHRIRFAPLVKRWKNFLSQEKKAILGL